MSTESTTPRPDDDPETTGESITVGESDRDPETVEVVQAPSRRSQIGALVAAAIGAGLTAPFAILAVPFAVAGLAIVAGAVLLTYSRGWLSVGIGLLLGGAIITGGYGAVPAEFLLVGVAAALVAFDIGQYGIDVGEQLGRGTRTRRLEIIHATATVFALTVATAFTYVVYLVAGAGRPASAVALSVIGAIILTWMFRR